MVTAWKSAATEKNYRQRQQYQAKTNTDKWENAGGSGPVKIPMIYTNQRWNINQ